MAFFCIHCKSEIDPGFKACPFCGEAITEFLRKHLEAPIDGKYRILSRLGVGGMGEVFKVLHVHLNAIRVIKLMRANIASDGGAHERFLREARLATRIQHPNVATLFDFSTLQDGSHYMVWEYIEGTNLHELIDQRGPLSPRYAAMLATQALRGLDAIHRAGVVHRDVSPENLMITREVTDRDGHERVKIIDLGIAKSLASDEQKSTSGLFVGKWKYCSPEHLGMLPAGERIDGRADLYSFGVVLYEMLTGVPPFQADSPHEYVMLHAQQRPKTLREANPRTAASPELEALIFRALEKDRAKRFATAREFAEELERITPSLSDVGGAPPPLPATAELTDEATRMTAQPRSHGDATRMTQAKTEISERILIASPEAAFAAEPAQRRSGAKLAAAAALLAITAAGAWTFTRAKAERTTPKAAVHSATVPLAAPPRTTIHAPARLALNAFPWANVVSIRNLDNGESVDLGAGLTTPAAVDLAPGAYEVTFANPAFPRTVTRNVSMSAGVDATLTVHFSDPASAPLPDFGATR
ncbi:MAG TPA: serine/threonine-protein kinase [Thermoanaerobaculia bacterium]|nr:serine/threonine-protein kinase [Thermoanaerobaculia bacterium]